MLFIFLLINLIFSIPNTIQKFFELLSNDQISYNTSKWIESAIENDNCFFIISDKPKTSVFVLLHFSHLELRIKYSFSIKTVQIFKYQEMFWCSKYMDSQNRLKMLLFIKKILLKLKINEKLNIAVDVFADELDSNFDFLKNNEETIFIRDLINLINEKTFNFLNVDFKIKKSIQQPEEIVNIFLSKKISCIAFIPPTREILDLLIYKNLEYRKVINNFIDENIKNRINKINNDAEYLCDYIFYKLCTDLGNLKYFLDFIINTTIKFDYVNVDFYSITLKYILSCENFCLYIQNNSKISQFLGKLEYPKFKQINSTAPVEKLCEFINGKLRFLDKNTYNEYEDFCQEILIVLYQNLNYLFRYNFQLILLDKEQRHPLHDKIFELLFKVYSILENKVNIVKNMNNVKEFKTNTKICCVKGLRTNFSIKSFDFSYIEKIESKLKTMKEISRSLYDLVRLNN